MKEQVLRKAKAFQKVNELTMKGEIVIFGSTYMANFPFYELINKCELDCAVYNRSIEGMTWEEASVLLDDCVLALKPTKIFLAVEDDAPFHTDKVALCRNIVHRIRKVLSSTQIYLVCLSDEAARYFAPWCEQEDLIQIDLTDYAQTGTQPYRAQFKKLSCHFHQKQVSMGEAFSLANL